MTTIPVYWVSYRDSILARGYADQGFLEAALADVLWQAAAPIMFEHHQIRDDFPSTEGAVVIINARTHSSPRLVRRFKEQLDRLEWSLVLLCGDEEWNFPWREIRHHSRRVWAMQARPEHHNLDGRFIPGGWYPQTRSLLTMHDEIAVRRPLDWFFGGQITHERRQECAAVLRELDGGLLVETDHYLAEGIPKADYFQMMASAKVIPCPSGPYSVDCARAFEALEAGCVPVLDVKTAYAGEFDYWALLFGDAIPAPLTHNWYDLPQRMKEVLEDWHWFHEQTYSFWQQYKRGFVRRLHADVRALSGQPAPGTTPDEQITVVVTTSPAPIHPSLEHLERTLDSIRDQLPLADIVLAFDGVRPEQEHLRAAYEEYVQRALWKCNFDWVNVVPYVARGFRHQAKLTELAMEHVHTPLILFVEHDTPIVGDIQWDRLCGAVRSGEANVIQLHINDRIIPEHQSIMLDPEPKRVEGVWLRRTKAWWQRPHLANADFYRGVLAGIKGETMIEDAVYPVVQNAIADHGEPAWWNWRLYVYEPDTPSILRSIHLDSRGEEPKY